MHWREEEYYAPPATFIAKANAADPAIFERFSENIIRLHVVPGGPGQPPMLDLDRFSPDRLAS